MAVHQPSALRHEDVARIGCAAANGWQAYMGVSIPVVAQSTRRVIAPSRCTRRGRRRDACSTGQQRGFVDSSSPSRSSRRLKYTVRAEALEQRRVSGQVVTLWHQPTAGAIVAVSSPPMPSMWTLTRSPTARKTAGFGRGRHRQACGSSATRSPMRSGTSTRPRRWSCRRRVEEIQEIVRMANEHKVPLRTVGQAATTATAARRRGSAAR